MSSRTRGAVETRKHLDGIESKLRRAALLVRWKMMRIAKTDRISPNKSGARPPLSINTFRFRNRYFEFFITHVGILVF